MEPLPHRYEVKLSGGPEDYATLSASGIPDLRAAPPKDFDGPGDAWGPEYLLLAAVEACFMFTFRAIAQASKLDFLSLDVSGVGTVDRDGRAIRFVEIILKPRLKFPKETNPQLIERVLEKSKDACIVTASLSVPVRLETQTTTAES